MAPQRDHPYDQAAGHPERVIVITHAKLIDAASEECIYWRRDGKGLACGCYVVTWSPGVSRRVFNEDAHFVGPFRTEQETEAALCRAIARWTQEQAAARVASARGEDRKAASARQSTPATRSDERWSDAR
jgi:hypothetical protein